MDEPSRMQVLYSSEEWLGYNKHFEDSTSNIHQVSVYDRTMHQDTFFCDLISGKFSSNWENADLCMSHTDA